MAHVSEKGLHWWEVLPMVVITNDMGKCNMCGAATVYIDLNFESHLCYPDCINQMWKNYTEAVTASDIRRKANESK